MLIKKVDRPRDLKWYQAGAMLYGDWGTSKAYVLGIAFALSGHASWFLLGLMASLTALVGVCYMIVCRIYPDGGGVYSSVKHRSQLLAVVGALLLVADYVVTASLSALDAFHYFNLPHPELWAMGAIFLIGAINWLGPDKGGTIATWIAIAASVTAGILFCSTLPHLPHVQLSMPTGGFFHNWNAFVGIVLALSGVEAIANMTGIMEQPVEKTARKAILPVLLEVTVLTFLLGIAMNAIPGMGQHEHTEDMLRSLGTHYIGEWYGHVISFVFGFLLLSAVNSAITGLVSIQFLLSRDRELPEVFGKLNRFGMPWLSLLVATGVPIIVLIVQHEVVGLAALYAIGVVGAITLNLASCASNFKIELKPNERIFLIVASVILIFVEGTICLQKHQAVIFAASVLAVGLTLRFTAQKFIPVPITLEIPDFNVLTIPEAKEITALYKCSFLVALRTLNTQILDEAALRAKALGENSIYLLYVEEAPALELPTEIEPSKDSLELLAGAQKHIEEKGITAIPVWHLGENPGRMIARAAKELEVNTVLIGTTKRSALVSLLRGDVLRNLSANLPKNTHLLITS